MKDHTEPLVDTGAISKKLTPIISPKKERKKYLPMLHGKATDSIALMAGQKLQTTTKNLQPVSSIEANGVQLILQQVKTMKTPSWISTHKLLCVAISQFSETNHTGTAKDKHIKDTAIAIPLKDYARGCGYRVDPELKTTPEEQEKENKRAANAEKEARKRINRDLTTIYNASLSWSDNISGDYSDVRLIEEKGIKKGMIYMHFGQKFSDYLIKLPMTQYPTALLAVDERNPNAYKIGIKLATHFNMDNNLIKGTENRLQVKKLLSVTDLPTIEEVRKKGKSWRDRIMDPFEKALELLEEQLIEDREYTHAKGVPMTDEEAQNFTSYEEWANCYITFTLKDAPNHEQRLKDKEERKKEAEKKRKRRTTKNKKVN